jgi:hypothetical protein
MHNTNPVAVQLYTVPVSHHLLHLYHGQHKDSYSIQKWILLSLIGRIKEIPDILHSFHYKNNPFMDKNSFQELHSTSNPKPHHFSYKNKPYVFYPTVYPKTALFRDVMPCSLVTHYKCLSQSSHPHFEPSWRQRQQFPPKCW